MISNVQGKNFYGSVLADGTLSGSIFLERTLLLQNK